MINTVVIVGVIETVHISEPKRADKATAAILVRYGDLRNQTGKVVEFVHAVLVRVPPFRLPMVRDQLKVGAFVHVIGHLQGLVKNQAGQAVFDVEVVVDRIDFMQGLNSVVPTHRKDRGSKPRANGADRHEPTQPAESTETAGHDVEVAADAILEGGEGADQTVGSAPEASETPEAPVAA
jgi:hypothetical protein